VFVWARRENKDNPGINVEIGDTYLREIVELRRCSRVLKDETSLERFVKN
jgi:hypothetical protein